MTACTPMWEFDLDVDGVDHVQCTPSQTAGGAGWLRSVSEMVSEVKHDEEDVKVSTYSFPEANRQESHAGLSRPSGKSPVGTRL